ncbi:MULTISPECIES: hypothetical protein [unclassified Bradyrhizobium]|uniref:hypothetical protein n=1 Tax=unclassified Bradyrhizobium TaxID=2631580 RepID=UPI0028EA0EB6|nr:MULTISPECIES: hypothetical protein [unclassified Bradyrhizobium]
MFTKALTFTLAAAAGTLMAAAASAAPMTAGVSVVPESNIQQVRMVCNENGRCWRERRERRVIIREDRGAYGYGRGERRGYEDRDRGGVGIRAPGVSVGIGRY